MTEKCKNCKNYVQVDGDIRLGKEWANNTGWCKQPRLDSRVRKTHESNWCDMWCEEGKYDKQ
jgi:hypothetical protein